VYEDAKPGDATPLLTLLARLLGLVRPQEDRRREERKPLDDVTSDI
jgi:hypothetical protein